MADPQPAREQNFTVAIGQEVHGRDGKLGQVERVVVDADSDTVSELVVKHGFLFGNERLVPLDRVQRADGSVLYIDMDEEQFSACDGFDPKRYRAPDPDYTGPPGFDAASGRDFNYDTVWAGGPLLVFGTSSKPLGFPGGELQAPADVSTGMWRPALKAGDDVLSSDFEKVGEVAAFEAEVASGKPTRLVMKQGFLFKKQTELPSEWLSDLSDRGVVLTVPKDTVERFVAEQAD